MPDPCLRCGLPRTVQPCPATAAHWRLDAVVAPFAYAGRMRRHIHALKYTGARRLGRALGLLLVPALEPFRAHLDLVVAVPLHRGRWRERGYNQALEIAHPVALGLGLPLAVHGIERRRATPAQSGLGAADRARNLAGAFHVRPRLDGQRICIVDDVITTGTTVNALAEALLGAGALAVMAAAMARTE